LPAQELVVDLKLEELEQAGSPAKSRQCQNGQADADTTNRSQQFLLLNRIQSEAACPQVQKGKGKKSDLRLSYLFASHLFANLCFCQQSFLSPFFCGVPYSISGGYMGRQPALPKYCGTNRVEGA
jgi:hypothetical protein